MAWTWTGRKWHAASGCGKWFRSTRFAAIETAIDAYQTNTTPRIALGGLLRILTAISGWWVWKQDKNLKIRQEYAASPLALTEAERSQNKIFSARHDVVAQLIKDVIIEANEKLAQARIAWGMENFSNPRQKPDNFLYLVSAQTETPLQGEPEYRIASVRNPRLIQDAIISASLIKKGDVKLWGPAGFILAAPQQNIWAASEKDIATDNKAGLHHELAKYIVGLKQWLGQGDSPRGLPSPNDIFVRPRNTHCEVVVLGRTYDSTVRVNGIYMLVDGDQTDRPDQEIVPANCYKVIKQYRSQSTIKGFLVTPLPLVTPARLQIYRDLNTQFDLPIVPITVDQQTSINVPALSYMYQGRILFPKPPNAYVTGTSEATAFEDRAREEKWAS